LTKGISGGLRQGQKGGDMECEEGSRPVFFSQREKHRDNNKHKERHPTVFKKKKTRLGQVQRGGAN